MLFFNRIHLLKYEGKVIKSRSSLHETGDKWPLDKESDRSSCHRHTVSMIKLFWSQPMGISSSIRARWKVLSLAYNLSETWGKWPLGKDPDSSWCRHTTVKHTSVLPLSPWIHGLQPRKLYTCMVVTQASVWVPNQRSLVPSFALVVG